MDDQASGLVDDYDVRIFIDDVKIHLLRKDIGIFRFRNLSFDNIPDLHF